MTKQKIALVYDAIYPYVKGGGEKRFYELGRQLVSSGHEVHLYGMKFWHGPDVIKKDGLYLHGICRARPLYKKNGRRSMAQAIIFGLSCLKLVREDFDVLDCCGFPYFSLFSCKLVTLIKRKPLYATWHEVWGKQYWRSYLGPLGTVGYMVERLAAKMPDVFIAVSDHTADLLQSTFRPRRPIHVVENGINMAKITALPAAPGKSDLIYVGRLVSFKHIDTLIRATQKVVKTLPKVRLLVIGDGPEKPKLEKLVGQLRLQKNVEFAGFKDDYDDVIAAMKSSRLFVLPSSREGFGIVALEANAAGVPVVTVDNKENAARKLINGKNGVVTKLSDRALAAAIEQLLARKPDAAACRQAAGRYDWAALSQKLEAILA